LVAKLTDIRYVYVRTWSDKQRVFKIVSFYLLLYRSGRVGNIPENMRHEVKRAFWLPLDEAAQQLTYRGEREPVKLAQAYLAAHSDAEHYAQERLREQREVEQIPEEEKAEVSEVFQAYGMTADESRPVVEALSKRPEAWIDFMMRFELGLEEPNPRRALNSA